MKIIYGDGLATHKRRCNGSNWTNNRRCEKEITFRTVDTYATIPPEVSVYCATHRHQAAKDGQDNEHVKAER